MKKKPGTVKRKYERRLKPGLYQLQVPAAASSASGDAHTPIMPKDNTRTIKKIIKKELKRAAGHIIAKCKPKGGRGRKPGAAGPKILGLKSLAKDLNWIKMEWKKTKPLSALMQGMQKINEGTAPSGVDVIPIPKKRGRKPKINPETPAPVKLRKIKRRTDGTLVINDRVNLTTLAMTLNEMAREKGFWKDRRPTDALLLIHSEVSEVVEALREGANMTDFEFKYLDKKGNELGEPKPEGVPMELADIIIRVLDLCGAYGIDIHAAIQRKAAYNQNRPYMHGKKF